ncbi:peptidoglycan-binding protein LysM [Paracoccus sp. p4-l81]|uniref:peptidoglycan-binding protein LysM n=1 Tax=unclassified Paracoccus (in: a-proteobacteria) TaxID=2688777 RepID=UPI0035BAC42D
MAIWDFVKDAGKSLFGGAAEAAEPKAAAQTADVDPVQAQVAALQKEVADLGISGDDIRLRLSGDTVSIIGKVKDAATAEKLILAVGNVKGIARVNADELDYPRPAAKAADADAPKADAAKAQTQAADGAVFYTVKKGDTLSEIAQKTLGKANRYNDIFEANKPMLSHPDKIYPGQVLRIPQA